jgi:pimeloyl-ACP methyl ester carboxylesterase
MIDLENGTNRAFASGSAQEMIIVVPDSLTVHGGSMYSTSVTSGDFAGFIARDLVAYVDEHYRTLARRESRGLSGHSMGGYGTWRIATKHPELYSSIYAMSSCCLAPYTADGPGLADAAQIRTLEDAAAAGIGARVQLTLAAAWSPNPNKPPLYFDFPVEDGEVDPLVLAKWNANVPLAVVRCHRHRDRLAGRPHRLEQGAERRAYGLRHRPRLRDVRRQPHEQGGRTVRNASSTVLLAAPRVRLARRPRASSCGR